MNRTLGGLIAGLLFGSGLAISGMINPAKVLGFLDIAGNWDPALAFVMVGAVSVAAIGYRLVLRRDRPLFESTFAVPTRRDFDAPLLVGAAVFGLGWGLAGYCPGPALASFGFGNPETFVFVAAMIAGMLAARHPAVGRLLSRKAATS